MTETPIGREDEGILSSDAFGGWRAPLGHDMHYLTGWLSPLRQVVSFPFCKHSSELLSSMVCLVMQLGGGRATICFLCGLLYSTEFLGNVKILSFSEILRESLLYMGIR